MRAKLAKALGGWPDGPFGDALEIGAGTGYFCLNLAPARPDRARRPRPTSRRGCSTRSAPPPSELGLEVERRCAPTPSSCRSRTRASTSSSATPCCTTSPTSSAGAGGVPPGPAAGRNDRLLRRAVALRRPDRGGAEARRALVAPAVAPRDRAPAARDRGRPTATATSSSARSTSTPSRPGDLRATAAATPASSEVRVRGEELLANAYGWWCARSRRPPSPTRSRGLAQASPSAATSRCSASTRAARAAPAAAALLQPRALGAQARADGPSRELTAGRRSAWETGGVRSPRRTWSSSAPASPASPPRGRWSRRGVERGRARGARPSRRAGR